MADYSDLKVTELKEELKKRSIASTGLSRKQQIIDRLIEDDDAKTSAQEDEPAAEKADDEEEKLDAEVEQNGKAEENGEQPEAQQEQTEQEQHPTQEPAQPDTQTTQTIADDAAQATNTVESAAQEDVVQAAPTDDATNESGAQADAIEDPVIDDVAMDDVAQEANTEAQGQESSPDNRKRKRPSLTPPVADESAVKKLKQDEEESHVDAPNVPLDNPDATVQPMATSDDVLQVDRSVENPATTTDDQEPAPRRASTSRSARSPNQRRFKDIINPLAGSGQDSSAVVPDDNVDAAPALHPATRALYIKGLIRPINVNAMKDHLEHLATPPDNSASDGLVEECYVDALKTHAFVLFDSISAASRARASLHSRVWPAEAQRKPLWVDFIPEERMFSWMEQERSEGGTRASTAKRWEVAYEVVEDGVDVRLIEASGSGGSRTSFAQGMPGAPLGPRGGAGGSASGPRRPSVSQSDRRRPSDVQPPPSRRPTAKSVEEASASFLELDKLFRFTAAKPKLYWQPVSDKLADKRLDELDRETSRDWDPRKDARLNGDSMGRGLDQLKRYTFEDGDVLVDGGPEYGGGAAFGRGGESYRGGGGGGGGGRRRGPDRYR
ncbi:hypothetical protein AAFC00_004058 [Neodothiora populina]|uniref:SAP domain-containing protein n=1 Tax=Neodothiora populina TaxID=2781224 RepID=A0ABR3PIM6_9PEZI